MSLLRASLLLLPLLALTVACSGRRADPEPGQSGTQTTEGGGGSSTNNGGSPSNGGNGGAPGSGGAPSTGGSPATGGAPGVGGNSGLNLAADIHSYCGCLDDAQDVGGACANCVASADCATDLADCPAANCGLIVTALRDCTFNDLPCYEAAYNLAPAYFDDAVSLISCECNACATPVCDNTACMP